MKRTPLTVTVFGRTITLRGDIDALDRYGGRKDAIGGVDAITIKVARSSTGGYLVNIRLGELADWLWAKNRDLNKAVASAERLILERLKRDEVIVRAARKIVGQR